MIALIPDTSAGTDEDCYSCSKPTLNGVVIDLHDDWEGEESEGEYWFLCNECASDLAARLTNQFAESPLLKPKDRKK